MARTTRTKQTAAACYTERFDAAQDLLTRIARKLAEHRAEQAADSTNWGHAGDLGHVNEQLAQVLASFGDTSAAEALGLEC